MRLDEIKPLHEGEAEPYEPYIVVTLTERQYQALLSDLLLEGGWRPTGVGDLWVRVNPPKPQMNLPANAHVAHEKHISAKNKQVSWESEHGKRHDKMTFNKNFSPMEKAKQVARTALRLPDDFILEELSTRTNLFESDGKIPSGCICLYAKDEA